MNINAVILDRKDRKFWYIRYEMFFENDEVVTSEESTKILKSEKDLKFMQTKYLPAWISEKKQKQIVVRKTKNFEYYANIFLKDYEVFHDYQNMQYRIDRILKQFAQKDISKITKLEIKIWLNELKHAKTNEELSKKSKLKYLSAFHRIFEVAVDDNVFEKNWTYDIQLKCKNIKNDNSIKPFIVDEVLVLLEQSKNRQKYGEFLHEYLQIAFQQGMSPSEILGLQVSDIDVNKKTINISRNITKSKVKETKNNYRNREIPIFDSALKSINVLIENAISKKTMWLFSDEKGDHLRDIQNMRGNREIIKNNLRIKNTTKWYKLLEDCNIEYRDIKNCRHTFAVRAIESKMLTMQEIANLLGHSDLKMLVGHYAKWITDKALSADRSIKLF